MGAESREESPKVLTRDRPFEGSGSRFPVVLKIEALSQSQSKLIIRFRIYEIEYLDKRRTPKANIFVSPEALMLEKEREPEEAVI